MAGELAMQTLVVRENNDVVVTATVTDPTQPLVAGKQPPLDLTGRTCTLVRKLSRDTLDSDPSFRSYAGSIQSPSTAGIVTFSVPAADNVTPAVTWWRLDVVTAGKTVTAQYGPFTVEAA